MASHSSTLAWKIPWMEEPGRLQSMGSLRVRYDWVASVSLFTFHFHALEKEMAMHSSVLAWRIPGTGEPGGLPSMGSHSRTRLKWLSSSSSSMHTTYLLHTIYMVYTLMYSICTVCAIIYAIMYTMMHWLLLSLLLCTPYTFYTIIYVSVCCCCLVTQSCPTLWDSGL